MATGQRVMPRYEVVPLPGVVMRPIAEHDKERGGFKFTNVEQPAGFEVFFPRGHSIRVKDETALRALRLDGEPDMVDMETGESAPDDSQRSLQNRAQAKQAKSAAKSRRRDMQKGGETLDDLLNDEGDE